MKEVDLIYEKIKTNKYSIPDSARISQEGRELIKKILAHNPGESAARVRTAGSGSSV